MKFVVECSQEKPIIKRNGNQLDIIIVEVGSNICRSNNKSRAFDQANERKEFGHRSELSLIQSKPRQSKTVKIPANAAKKLTRLYLKYKRMVGSNGTMIAIRLVRSKLRKREDSQHHNHHHQPNQVHPEQVQRPPVNMMDNNHSAVNPASANAGLVNPAMSSSNSTVDSCCNDKQQQQAASSIVAAALENAAAGATMVYTTGNGCSTTDQFIWQFPPPYPPPNTPPPQYTLYNDQVCFLFSSSYFISSISRSTFILYRHDSTSRACSFFSLFRFVT